MPSDSADRRDRGKTEVTIVQADQYQRKLQRILRNQELGHQNLSGGIAPADRERMTEQMKSATLSPKIISPSSVPADEGPLFQCTECDMIVKESDPYCPFCGAIFADGPLGNQEAGYEHGEPGNPTAPSSEGPARKEPFIRPEKFDIFSMLKTGSRSHELMYQEALRGFSGSTRLLEDIERLISDVGAIGKDTSAARRLISSAWEACRDGDWNLVMTLARQTEELVEPSIPDLVKAEIARAREYLLGAKAGGTDISGYILKIKSAMAALRSDDPDEALRLTKELMDSIREDSISWKK